MRPNGPKRPNRNPSSSTFKRDGQRPNGPKRPNRQAEVIHIQAR